MSTADAPTVQQSAVPAPTVGPAPAADPDTTPARPRRYIGQHRRTGRHSADAVRPVDVGHRLSPAARQLVAPTPEDQAVHAGPDDATGLYRPADIQTARTQETTSA